MYTLNHKGGKKKKTKEEKKRSSTRAREEFGFDADGWEKRGGRGAKASSLTFFSPTLERVDPLKPNTNHSLFYFFFFDLGHLSRGRAACRVGGEVLGVQGSP